MNNPVRSVGIKQLSYSAYVAVDGGLNAAPGGAGGSDGGSAADLLGVTTDHTEHND